MTRLALFLIGLVTPPGDRESVVGDTIERLDELRSSHGSVAAARWLWRETARVICQSPRHRLAALADLAVQARHGFTVEPERDTLLSTLSQDVRYAVRWLRRSPGLTAIAIVTLALGIGANTAMFAAVNAVLLKPLPFAAADRLMLVHLLAPDREAGPGVYAESVWSFPKYQTLVGLQHVFDDTALYGARAVSLSGDGDPERLRAEIITDRYLSVLGVTPLLGRGLSPEETNRTGAAPAALMSHGLWMRRYGAAPRILGRTIAIGGVAHEVVGVLPQGFRGLNGNADLWLPLGTTDGWALTERQSHSYMLVGIRKPGVSEAEASAAVRVYGGQLDAEYRNGNGPLKWSASATSLYASRLDSDLRRASLVVLGAVGCVLLIACVNLTNLLVAGAIARHREVAIRVALGAGRSRIARQFAVEGLLLAAIGALGGLIVASGLLAAATMVLPDSEVFLRSAVTPGTRRIAGAAGLTRIGAGMIGLDPSTLLFTAGVTVLTALLVSILPAFQASSLRPAQTLKAGGGTSTARGSRGFGSRSSLVAIEIALALVLLAGAGLMLKSAMRLRDTSLGIDPRSVLTAGVSLPSASYTPDAGRNLYAELVARVQTLPGVEVASLGSCPPVTGGCNSTSIWFPPRPHTDISPLISIYWATPGYFDTLRIRVLQGRGFTDADRVGQPKVVVVNETAARTFWPNGNAIGQKIAVGQGGFHDGAEVVGVVSDVRYRAIEAAAGTQVYVPLAQSYQSGMRLFVRSSVDTTNLVAAISREVRALDANLPIIGVKTMEGYVGDAMWRTRVATWLLSAFAALALLLTAIGVFGVMAQTVAQRTQEFGIRMALGAQRRDVLSLVFGRGVLVTGAGLAAGLVASLAATRVIAAFLYDVAPSDPVTLGAVALLLGGVSLAACYVPARRATRVDAIVALRNE